MKKASTSIVIIAVVALTLIYSASYIVGEYEQVVIVQFGKVVRIVDKPGLYFKIPFYEEARRFEKRWLEWDGDANQITTLDKRYIYIDVFARWRIKELKVFIETLRNEKGAQGRLDDIINSATRNVIANHKLIEAIRTTSRSFAYSDEEANLTGGTKENSESPPPPDEPVSDKKDKEQALGQKPEQEPEQTQAKDDNKEAIADEKKEPQNTDNIPADLDQNSSIGSQEGLYAIKFGREKLTDLILEKASAKASQLGIELKDVQIKRIDYIESVQAKVFDRMISERKRVADALRSQGRGKSAEILGQMEKELKQIRSEAYRVSQEIMGKADAEAAAIYANVYKTDPEFYNFVKTMETYRKTIDESSWILLSTEAEFARRLKQMKDK
jgi:membrane protease subunit HflC